MKKKSKLGMILLLTFSIYACNNPIVNTSKTERVMSLSELKEKNMGAITLNIEDNPFTQKGFRTKSVDFSDTNIKKLKLRVRGLSIKEDVFQTIDWTPGNKASFNLNVIAGKNRILDLSALDADGNVLATLMGALDVLAGKSNTAKISHLNTVVAQTLLNLLNSSKPEILDTVVLENLKTYITNITGYNSDTHIFSKINPALVNTALISNAISTNNGTLPQENLEGLESSGSVKVILNQTGAKIMINDLSSTAINSTTANETIINNVSTGEWFLTVMKDGFATQSVKVVVTAGNTTNTTINLAVPTASPSPTATPTATATPSQSTSPTPAPSGSTAPDGTIVGCLVRTGTTTELYSLPSKTYKSEESKFNLVQFDANFVGSRNVYDKRYNSNQILYNENNYDLIGNATSYKSYDYTTGVLRNTTNYERDSKTERITKIIYTDYSNASNSYVETAVYTETNAIFTKKMNDGTTFKSEEIIYDPIFKDAQASVKNYDKDGKLTSIQTNKWIKIIVNTTSWSVRQSESSYESYDSNGNITYSNKYVYEYDTNSGLSVRNKKTVNTSIDTINGLQTTKISTDIYTYTSDKEYIVNTTVNDSQGSKTFKSREQSLSGGKIIYKYYQSNGNISSLQEREDVKYWKPTKNENYNQNGILNQKTEYVYSNCPQ